ncbi:hypothetical protein POM88_042739 [Heracleum sosnowskyi]|uniref:F-box domain-containing protein n=1 Tax=Heracleum sosnowskyi TaxID=360622 RepID=A0AAD8HI97_9APIA|nr:hypothetical protein POM88_042739 [Heracleum sosnowskyi]
MMSKLISCHSDANTSSSPSRNGIQSQMLRVPPYLTEHLVSEILSRLPVKALLQYRCVSKPWCSLIDSPRFVKAQLKRSIECNTNTGLVIRGDNFHLVDFDSLEHTTPVEIDEPLKTRLYGCSIVSTIDGLHCLFNPKPDIFIWNPATRKCRHLPTLPADFNRPFGFGGSSLCGFGYDAANDDYKVMRIQTNDSGLEGSKVIVYGLKTHSWKRLKNIPYQFQYFGVWGMFMGGSLHWITIKSQGCPSILAVDLGVENHRELPLPKLRTKNVNQLGIITFEKSLCILEYLLSVRMNVWVMKDYGVGNSWCKLFSVEQQKVIGSFGTITPLAYSKNRQDVLCEVDNEKVMWYNPKRKKARTANIANLPSIFDLEFYTESLVPLDYNMSSVGKQLLKQPQEKKVQQQKKNKDERNGPQSQMLRVPPYLTEHLVSEILSRLPVKALLQYRCVSKPWCSLIDSPRFVKAQLKRSIECDTNTGLVIRGDNFHLVDFDSLEHTTPVEIDEPLKTSLYGCSIVSSINGLHCLFNPKPDIFIWNPATRKYRHLPTLPADFNRPFGFGGSSLCGFGYDAANDDYKVMRIQTDDSGSAGSKVIVYGLKTHSWKRFKNIPYKFQHFGVWGMFMGGSLHWITIKGQGCPSILAVTLGLENHRELPLPKLQTKNVNQLSIITFEKSLCILEYLLSVRMNVWVMKDYGVGNSWCKLFSVEQRKVMGSFVTITPLAYSKSRKDVLLEVDNKKVLWYNPIRKKARTAKIANLPSIFDLEVYTESLVPLDYNTSSDGKQLQKQPQQKKLQQQKKKKDEGDKFLSKGFKLVL